MMTDSRCRFCNSVLTETFADLGMSPLANSFISIERAREMESFYPLHAFVCSECRLVQLDEFATPDSIFSDYLYFSSFSDAWLRHAETYVGIVAERFGLNQDSRVVEIASNDGYLLQYFQRRGVPVLGIEPAQNIAQVAIKKGIPTEVAFFGKKTASRLLASGVAADLMVANNVVAHVPDINDFVSGFGILLKPDGVVTFEFPHLLRLIAEKQFDTIYHEHFSYLSLHVIQRVLKKHGLRVFDVDEVPTHGGSLRVFSCRNESKAHGEQAAVGRVLGDELKAGLEQIDVYRDFAKTAIDTKCQVVEFLIAARRAGKRVVAYGAPAKGNTLLNYCGVRTDLLEFTVDRSPHKQGMLLPGSRLPIKSPEALIKARPDYVFILPWNWKDEIVEQMAEVRSWGGQFVVPIPKIEMI
jgi:2-polyprenyl-3-methyl-5-hydroxy-6-metoxy-1,4-benzoquinol methylase